VSLSFFIPGKPKPKGRGRTVRLKTGRVVTFTPADTVKYENWVRMIAADAMVGREPFAVPLFVRIDIYVRRPKKPKFANAPATRPDLDNYEKAILDGMGLAGVYTDDAIVCWKSSSKEFADDLNPEGARVYVGVDEGF